MSFTHINDNQQPAMVDVSRKDVTRRTAVAQAVVTLPSGVMAELRATADNDLASRKGPVLQTAILAGIMAAKKTQDLIPLCHQIPLEKCDVDIQVEQPDRLRIVCTARATHKTGVEMEALTGATLAALTIYDMCKALSHEIVIGEIRLVEKTGGQRDIHDSR